jgi:hypothetical protein
MWGEKTSTAHQPLPGKDLKKELNPSLRERSRGKASASYSFISISIQKAQISSETTFPRGRSCLTSLFLSPNLLIIEALNGHEHGMVDE